MACHGEISSYRLMSLAAPMLLPETGDVCHTIRIDPAFSYSIGRSKKLCHIVFKDSRVSRLHCQVCFSPQHNAIVLFDGAAAPPSFLQNAADAGIREALPPSSPAELSSREPQCKANPWRMPKSETRKRLFSGAKACFQKRNATLKSQEKRTPAAMTSVDAVQCKQFLRTTSCRRRENLDLQKCNPCLPEKKVKRSHDFACSMEDMAQPKISHQNSDKGRPKVVINQHRCDGLGRSQVAVDQDRCVSLRKPPVVTDEQRCDIPGRPLAAADQQRHDRPLRCAKSSPLPRRPSLNGIFVNGEALGTAEYRVLHSGDEVSLVGPTKAGLSIDSDCQQAVGFLVEKLPSAKYRCDSPVKGSASASPLSSNKKGQATHCTVGDNFSPGEECNWSPLSFGCSAHVVGKSIKRKHMSSTKVHSVSDEALEASSYHDIDGAVAQDQHDHVRKSGKGEVPSPQLVITLDLVEVNSPGSQDGARHTRSSMSASPNSLRFSIDLDSKMVSTLNLIKASKRLRNCVTEMLSQGDTNAFESMELSDKVFIKEPQSIGNLEVGDRDGVLLQPACENKTRVLDIKLNTEKFPKWENIDTKLLEPSHVDKTANILEALIPLCGNILQPPSSDCSKGVEICNDTQRFIEQKWSKGLPYPEIPTTFESQAVNSCAKTVTPFGSHSDNLFDCIDNMKNRQLLSSEGPQANQGLCLQKFERVPSYHFTTAESENKKIGNDKIDNSVQSENSKMYVSVQRKKDKMNVSTHDSIGALLEETSDLRSELGVKCEEVSRVSSHNLGSLHSAVKSGQDLVQQDIGCPPNKSLCNDEMDGRPTVVEVVSDENNPVHKQNAEDNPLVNVDGICQGIIENLITNSAKTVKEIEHMTRTVSITTVESLGKIGRDLKLKAGADNLIGDGSYTPDGPEGEKSLPTDQGFHAEVSLVNLCRFAEEINTMEHTNTTGKMKLSSPMHNLSQTSEFKIDDQVAKNLEENGIAQSERDMSRIPRGEMAEHSFDCHLKEAENDIVMGEELRSCQPKEAERGIHLGEAVYGIVKGEELQSCRPKEAEYGILLNEAEYGILLKEAEYGIVRGEERQSCQPKEAASSLQEFLESPQKKVQGNLHESEFSLSHTKNDPETVRPGSKAIDNNLAAEIDEACSTPPLHAKSQSLGVKTTEIENSYFGQTMEPLIVVQSSLKDGIDLNLIEPSLTGLKAADELFAVNQGEVDARRNDGQDKLELGFNHPPDCEINKGGPQIRVQSLPVHTHSAGYFLNRLERGSQASTELSNTVSLQELLTPVDNIQSLFIATFTYDVPWFLSFAGLSREIPLTIACHDAERCWSVSNKDCYERPYLDWPNVTLVYPQFPTVCAFGKDKRRRGIGCHHPKIFLIRRTDSIRVIISSANLTYRQWFDVSNNIWWQDFPCRCTPSFQCLFQKEESTASTTTADFASQLAGFLALLLADAPSEAHWVTDLANYDFSCAMGSLVASIPGLHYPLYDNAPEFLTTLEKDSYSLSQDGDGFSSKHLGIVPTTVVGIPYRFRASADPKGVRIRALAAVLNDNNIYTGSTMPVLLKRAKYLAADPNAVSVVVTANATRCSQDLYLQEDLHNADINTVESETLQPDASFVKLGFLPRAVAGWISALCDSGYFSFAACIWPSEALAVASGQSDGVVKLALYVFEGPKFSALSPGLLTYEEITAFSGLLKSLHRPWGLWRLEQVLSKYKWPDSYETDFFFASSSIGTSVDARFLAAFAAAAGKRSIPSAWSQESDPEWGCWTADQEAHNPSIGIVFPSVQRVIEDNFSHFGLLCFAEPAWLRLKPARLLHDSIPYPCEREGFPMHSKVARRRFQQSSSSRPFGWFYCGSHNFSPAAWGRPIWRASDGEPATDAGIALGSSLHISNFELGVLLVEPPPQIDHLTGDYHKVNSPGGGLDRFVMPFKVPPPKYTESDRPATGKAMQEAYFEMQLQAAMALWESEVPLEEEKIQDEELAVQGEAKPEAEEVYVEALWSQIEDQEG